MDSIVAVASILVASVLVASIVVATIVVATIVVASICGSIICGSIFNCGSIHGKVCLACFDRAGGGGRAGIKFARKTQCVCVCVSACLVIDCEPLVT